MIGLRPQPAWRRHDVSELRIRRLAADVERERAYHPEGEPLDDLLLRAVEALEQAATLATPPESD